MNLGSDWVCDLNIVFYNPFPACLEHGIAFSNMGRVGTKLWKKCVPPSTARKMAANTEDHKDMDAQIQEKTITSLTEDLKTKVDSEEKQENVLDKNEKDDKEENHQNGLEEVQASDNMNEEKSISEERAQPDESMKAENVSSTEAGPQANDTSINEEEKKNDNTDGKNKDEAQKKDEGLGSAVAKHYNEIPAGTKELRKDSRIFHLRSFNNWIKSVMINEFLQKIKRKKRTSDDVNVLDLACGKGGDLLKWQKGRVDHVIMADIAAISIDQCKERYARLEKDQNRSRHSRDPLFTIETFAEDCTKVVLTEKFKKPEIKLDLTSCQFAFHYSFESYQQADTMLKNACENLRVGGYFIGTTPDAQKLVKHIKTCKADSFGNSVYNIKPEDKEKFPLFGAKYMFYLEGVVDCPEFLVYFPALEKMAEKYNMKLVWKKNFHQMFKEYEREYSSLLQKMNAMEQYPAPSDKALTGGSESQYKSAKDYIDKKGSKHTVVGTLSADEWEVAGLYLAFAFEKVEPAREGRSTEREDRKRHRSDRSKDSSKSRSAHRHDDKRRSGSSSAKRSKKESESEEVYEVKDEIYEDETEKTDAGTEKTSEETPSSTTETPVEEKVTAPMEEKVTAPVEEKVTEETKETTEQQASIIENVTEETGTEVVDETKKYDVEVAQEVSEKDA
ncbi:mRNA cap guanine-N7 methyltransferase-like [Hydractinia symbiolongicarpus]|uniref:mRNA cap guanine-N7 methyltransferase-like n=1 Tax=Hydractinia symbiolongicarpus TaxID=13093 RepID=UPI00254ED0A6|nr:mRNA cap guanine-N7 methyltransferase-like [Hydractinia symbiolongicarpus]